MMLGLRVVSRFMWLGAIVLAGCASAPPAPEPVARDDLASVQRQLEAYIGHELAGKHLAGLSIALVDGQRTVWARGFGFADTAAKVPAGPDTLYRVGSISKLFTDTAAMQLVAQGQLALDGPVQRTLPWFRLKTAWPEAGPITLRQLMTHHAGLPRDWDAGMWTKDAPPPDDDFRAMLRRVADQGQAAAPPGLAFSYSNLGLDVVGALVEAASGRPFEQQLQQAVLEPLGMRQARFSAGLPNDPAMARGHFKGEPRDEPALRDVPAGGLSASVTDLARFVSMQFAGGAGVLPAAQQREMLQAQAGAPLDLDFRTGLGWMLTTFGSDTVHGGGPVAHHAGATFHFRSQLMLLPERGLGVVVASNDGAAGDVVNRVAQRALALLLEARTGVRQPGANPGFVPAAAPWSDAQWQALREACAGEYMTLAGPVALRPDGQRLAARIAGHGLELREGAEGRFGLGYRLLGLVDLPLGPFASLGFECRRIEGRPVLVAVQDGERLLAGERLPEAALPAWAAAWTGRYRPRLAPGEVPVLDPDSVRLRVDGGRLWVEYRLHPAFGSAIARLPLQPVSERAARLGGLLAGTGPVIERIEAPGAPPQVRFSGWTFERTGD